MTSGGGGDTPIMTAIWNMYGEDGDDYSLELYEAGQKLERALAASRAEAEAKQAKIDALMLEYCPEDMTPEQYTNWLAHQIPDNSPETKAAIDAALTQRGAGEET